MPNDRSRPASGSGARGNVSELREQRVLVVVDVVCGHLARAIESEDDGERHRHRPTTRRQWTERAGVGTCVCALDDSAVWRRYRRLRTRGRVATRGHPGFHPPSNVGCRGQRHVAGMVTHDGTVGEVVHDGVVVTLLPLVEQRECYGCTIGHLGTSLGLMSWPELSTTWASRRSGCPPTLPRATPLPSPIPEPTSSPPCPPHGFWMGCRRQFTLQHVPM